MGLEYPLQVAQKFVTGPYLQPV